MAYLPRVQIIDRYADPLVDDANVPLAEALMTNSTDTWEMYNISWLNADIKPRVILVRILAKNATGSLYEWSAATALPIYNAVLRVGISEETLSVEVTEEELEVVI